MLSNIPINGISFSTEIQVRFGRRTRERTVKKHIEIERPPRSQNVVEGGGVILRQKWLKSGAEIPSKERISKDVRTALSKEVLRSASQPIQSRQGPSLIWVLRTCRDLPLKPLKHLLLPEFDLRLNPCEGLLGFCESASHARWPITALLRPSRGKCGGLEGCGKLLLRCALEAGAERMGRRRHREGEEGEPRDEACGVHILKYTVTRWENQGAMKIFNYDSFD